MHLVLLTTWLAEHIPTKWSYGYRNGRFLITAEAAGAQNVSWQNAVGVSIAGNSLTKTGATGWNAGAASSQTIASGDGYVEFTAGETNKHRLIGLSLGNANQSWDDVDFCIYLNADGTVYINEGATARGNFGAYATGDVMRVAVEGGVVKYRTNGTLLYTSTVAPTYPLLVDTSLYTTAGTINNVVIFSAAANTTANINWLVADQLGTPRMVFDKTGALTTTKRHDYLPFGEELFATQGLRTSGVNGLGYTGDNIRQQFTLKERDNETGLDYFFARYYASTQGRFTGADPYDINFERQLTSNPREANALFSEYLGQPQHWNRYAYALNNPLKYVDPNGMKSYPVEVLGQTVTVHIDDEIIENKNDPDAFNRIKDNLQKAFDKINSGAASLTEDQIESIHSQNTIYVTNNVDAPGTLGGTFYIPQQTAENPNIDKLAGDIIHDSRHSEQLDRGLTYNEGNAIPMEREASLFTVGVINNIGGWKTDVVEGFEVNAITGHLPSGWRDKSTSKSRDKVFERMNSPQKRRK